MKYRYKFNIILESEYLDVIVGESLLERISQLISNLKILILFIISSYIILLS